MAVSGKVMNIFKDKGLLSVSIPLSLRCRYRVNIKHPRPLHKERRVLDAVTQPIYLNQIRDPLKNCSVLGAQTQDVFARDRPVNQVDMYNAFLVKEALKILESNQMIIAFQPEAIDARKRTAICNKLFAVGCSAVFFPLEILRQAVHSSKWHNMTVLLQSQTVLVVSKSANLRELLNATKKTPELVLLGGFVNDVLMTREGLLRCSRLPSIDVVRGELVSLLGRHTQTTRFLMQAAQINLSRSLDHLSKHSDAQSK